MTAFMFVRPTTCRSAAGPKPSLAWNLGEGGPAAGGNPPDAHPLTQDSDARRPVRCNGVLGGNHHLGASTPLLGNSRALLAFAKERLRQRAHRSAEASPVDCLQTSPEPSPVALRCSGLDIVSQLSATSGTPS